MLLQMQQSPAEWMVKRLHTKSVDFVDRNVSTQARESDWGSWCESFYLFLYDLTVES